MLSPIHSHQLFTLHTQFIFGESDDLFSTRNKIAAFLAISSRYYIEHNEYFLFYLNTRRKEKRRRKPDFLFAFHNSPETLTQKPTKVGVII